MDINNITSQPKLNSNAPIMPELSLKDLPKQAAFNAKVLFTNGETVNLKTSNGLILKARIEGNPTLKQGSDIVLKVSQNDGQTLVLKVVEQAASTPHQQASIGNHPGFDSAAYKALPADIQNILSRVLSENLPADQAGQILKDALSNYPNASGIKADLATVLSDLKLNPGFVQGLFNQVNSAPDLGNLLSQLSNSLQAMLNNNSPILSGENSQIINQILNQLLAAAKPNGEQVANQNPNQAGNQAGSQLANQATNQGGNQLINQAAMANSGLVGTNADLGQNTTLITSLNSQLNPAAADNILSNLPNNQQAAVNPDLANQSAPKLSLAQTMPLFGQPAQADAAAMASPNPKQAADLAANLSLNSSDNQASGPANTANQAIELNLNQISQNLGALGLNSDQQNALIEQIRQIAAELYPNNSFSLKAANDFIANLFVKLSPDLAENSPKLQQNIQELDLRLQVFKEALLNSDLPQKEDLLNLTNKLLQQLEPQRYLPDRLVALQIPIFDQNQQKTAALYVYKRAGKDRQIDPEDTSILLALQTAHLGRLEALIDIKGRQLAIKMEISAVDAIGFLRNQTASLYHLISEAGYSLINTTVGPLQSLVNNSQQAIAAMDQYRHSFGSKYDFKI